MIKYDLFIASVFCLLHDLWCCDCIDSCCQVIIVFDSFIICSLQPSDFDERSKICFLWCCIVLILLSSCDDYLLPAICSRQFWREVKMCFLLLHVLVLICDAVLYWYLLTECNKLVVSLLLNCFFDVSWVCLVVLLCQNLWVAVDESRDFKVIFFKQKQALFFSLMQK